MRKMSSSPTALGGSSLHEFHDSQLLNLEFSSDLSEIVIDIATPTQDVGKFKVWRVRFLGVLRYEQETLGDGSHLISPVEIYDIYALKESVELQRWRDRLRALGHSKKDLLGLSHIVLASSFYRGWGENEHLEGVNLICRNVEIEMISENSSDTHFPITSIPAKS